MTKGMMSPLAIAMLIAFVCAPSIDAFAETPACELGKELRTALGLGPMELAAMGVDEAHETSIINAATDYCDLNRETIEPLIVAVQTARQTTMGNYETGASVDDSDNALVSAIADLAAAAGDAVSTMQGSLNGNQQTWQSNVQANLLLDTSIAALDLTSEQRTSLRAAQATRDLVGRHHKNRKNYAMVGSAAATFEEAVAGILNETQQSQRASLQSALGTNLGTALQSESNNCAE